MKKITDKEAKKLNGKRGLRVDVLMTDYELRTCQILIVYRGTTFLLHSFRGHVRKFSYPQSAFRYIRDHLGLVSARVVFENSPEKP
ncbi:MAG: hypothetical protein JKY93_00395 [Gammaproteobacteria bacterium]|nr:hypothetical protein [Gammaproteobacteria bacterium]